MPRLHVAPARSKASKSQSAAKALRQEKDAAWRTWASLPAGTHEYRFIIDGEWLEDPSADAKQPNPFGSYNSVVSV